MTSSSTHTASLSTKLFFGSGSIAFGAKDSAFNYFLLVYYNQVLGLDAFLTGLALAVALAVDAVTDIVVGYWSDHLKSRWGRRHPFMFVAAPFVAISFYILWNPPASVLADQTTLFLFLVTTVIIVRTFITLFEVPNAALGPELTNDYDDRTRLQAFRYGFGWMGGLLLASSAFFVLFDLDPNGQLGPIGYEQLGLVSAVAMFCVIYVSAFGTRKHIPTFYRPTVGRRSPREALRHVFGLFKNQSFNSVFVSSIFFGAAQGLSQALLVYVTTYFWQLSAAQIGYVPLLGVVAVPAAFVLAPRMGERWGKKSAARFVYLFAILFLPTIYVAQWLGVFPAQSSQWYLPIILFHFLLESFAIIAMQILFASMSADIVEDRSQQQDGHRDEGLIYAARNFTKKAVSGIGIGLAGLILTIVGFPEGAIATEVPKSTVNQLVLLYVPSVMFLYLASWWAIRWYQIDRGSHLANLVALKQQ